MLAADHRADFQGQRLAVSSPQGRFADAAHLNGRALVSVDAHGKHLFYHFEGQRGAAVHVHLGLFGRFFRHRVPPPPPRETVRMRLVGVKRAVDLVGPTACALLTLAALRALRARLGEDPLRDDSDPDRAFERLRRCRAPIGAALLDQRLIAGVGNVYRAEALLAMGIHPERRAADLGRAEFDGLWTTICRMLRDGMRDRRIVTVAHPDGRRPTRRERVAVYGRRTCASCGDPVERWLLRGRWAYACPRCQPASAP